MEIMDIANKITKHVCLNVLIYLIFISLLNYKNNNYKKMGLIALLSIIETCITVYLSNYISTPIIIFVHYLFYGLIIAAITKYSPLYSIIITYISLSITYVAYIVGVVITALILTAFNINLEENNIGSLCVIMLNTSLILYLVARSKRIKKGIPFLKQEKKLSNIGIIGFSLIGVTIMIYSLINNSTDWKSLTYLFIGILIEAVCLFVWIRRRITRFYKQKLKERTVEELEKEIEAQSAEISKITEENQSIVSINHKYSSRIKALESFSSKVLSKPELVAVMKTEFGDDFANFEKQVQSISKEFTMEMENSIKHEVYLPKTEIFGIDNLLEHMCNEASKENIKFNLKINGNIKYMVENVIEQNRLETLLGDHIKDAIIAIKSSTNTYKSILVILGIIEDCYEICIYDTGIEFEIETLLKLGTERITTHKKTGGSGIGFMTTFETLDKTKASLIIEENHPMNSQDYTKAVKIRFDGKNEYRINSYRAEKIEEQTKNDRIKIKLKT